MSRRLIALALVFALCALGYVFVDAAGPWDFILPYRLTKLAALLLVGVALAVATVMFQTITANRILTPSLMGFDALYILILTALVHSLGSAGFAGLSPALLFGLNLSAMMALGLLLFAVLLRLARGDMVRLVLSGIVIGLLIRAATEFLQRLIDPSEFQTVQSQSFARFTQIDGTLLAISAAAVAVGVGMAWHLRHRLDVLSLGEVAATGLGEPPARLHRLSLLVICLLVASATSLAGPLASGNSGPSSFFGLIVTAFAHIVTPSHRHAILLPSAALIGGIVLVGGQFLMERLFHLSTPLTVVIELIGGAVFLYLLLKRRAA